MAWETPPLPILSTTLSRPENPIGMRTRATYYLRQIHDSTPSLQPEVILVLGRALRDPSHGSLMRHEIAYVMGQLRNETCGSHLLSTLSDRSDCPIVRHECAEALAAIGAPSFLPALREFSRDDAEEVSQTCLIAATHVEWRLSGGDAASEPAACACLHPYSSSDPAPPHPAHANLAEGELGEMVRDEKASLFGRYRAMFSLRNRGGREAALELGRALTEDQSSALLRHEVAYVLGQMRHPAAFESLVESLRREEEHVMVRHEAAEALGALEGRWEECEPVLREFLNDGDVVIRESCEVALDAVDYYGGGSGFDREEAEANVLNHFNVVVA